MRALLRSVLVLAAITAAVGAYAQEQDTVQSAAKTARNTRNITLKEAIRREPGDTLGAGQSKYLFNALDALKPAKVREAYRITGDSIEIRLEKHDSIPAGTATFWQKLATYGKCELSGPVIACTLIPPLCGAAILVILVWGLMLLLLKRRIPEPGTMSTADTDNAGNYEDGEGQEEEEDEEGEEEEEESEEEEEDGDEEYGDEGVDDEEQNQ